MSMIWFIRTKPLTQEHTHYDNIINKCMSKKINSHFIDKTTEVKKTASNSTVCSPTAISCGVQGHFPRPEDRKQLRERKGRRRLRDETVRCIQSNLIQREGERERERERELVTVTVQRSECSHWEHVIVVFVVFWSELKALAVTTSPEQRHVHALLGSRCAKGGGATGFLSRNVLVKK